MTATGRNVDEAVVSGFGDEWSRFDQATLTPAEFRTMFDSYFVLPRPFYVMRTDALDRFGTKLEQRFTRWEIETMLRDAGLIDIRFSETAPYWCAVGVKA